MPPDLISNAGPEWLVGLVAIAILLRWLGQVLAEMNESWAKALGPLGRRWRNRGLARQEARAADRTARMADLEDMTRQRDALADALKDCRRGQADVYDYLTYDADWHRRLRLTAAENGCQIPDHETFLRWKDQ